MKNELYILDEGGNPVEEPDSLKWGQWHKDNLEKRRVAREKVGNFEVSTVFLGLDHSFGGKRPVLYETMVFPTTAEIAERYFTKEDALEGHKRIVEELTNKLK